MINFVIALKFLTIIPVKGFNSYNEEDTAKSIAYFPIVGFVLGSILVFGNIFFVYFTNGLVLSTLLVLLLAVLTGGFHLDGLADTFDGIASSKTRERMLEIMKDSRIGTMGTLALIFTLLLKIFLLSKIQNNFNQSILILPVLSRWSMIIPMFMFNYARESGLGAHFKTMSKQTLIISTVLTFIIALVFMGLHGLIIMVCVSIFTVLFGAFINKKIGGFTGDTLGATCELNEVVILALF